jgi:hypothetical protein
MAAQTRVKLLRELNKEPSQKELNDSPALLRAWNKGICWDLVRAGKKCEAESQRTPRKKQGADSKRVE